MTKDATAADSARTAAKEATAAFYRKLYLGQDFTNNEEFKAAERRLKIVRHSLEALRSDTRDALYWRK